MKTTFAIVFVLGPIAAYGYWVYHTAEVFGLVTKPRAVVSYSQIRTDSAASSRSSRIRETKRKILRKSFIQSEEREASKPSVWVQMGRWFFRSVGLGNLLSSPPMAQTSRKFTSLSPQNALLAKEPPPSVDIAGRSKNLERVKDEQSESQLLQESLDFLTEKSDRDPNDHRPHMELVEAYARAKDFTSARRELMKVLELDPENKWAKETLIDIDSYLAQSDIAIAPLVSVPFDLYGELPKPELAEALSQDDIDKGIKLSEDRIVELKQKYGTQGVIRDYVPTGAELSRETLAMRYESEGSLEQAEEQWLTLLSDYRDSPGIHQNYALFLISNRRWDDAQNLLDRELPRLGQDSRLERIRDWLVSSRDVSAEDKEIGALELRYDLSLFGDIGKEIQTQKK